VTYEHIGHAIGEFTFSLNFANAPIDQYARGNRAAMTASQKRGALLFFGKAGCVDCHAVSGQSNEMFSDFREHVIGVPQIFPAQSNVSWDGPGGNEDFGLAQVTGNAYDRYAFRTSPIRNVSLQATFMHNGAYTRLEDAIRHHLDAATWATSYTPAAAGVAADLRGPMGPIDPVLERLDFRLRQPIDLTGAEFSQLVDFVKVGLTDPAATPSRLKALIPSSLPSGRAVHTFR
jgi:cytochrome c peroxidase